MPDIWDLADQHASSSNPAPASAQPAATSNKSGKDIFDLADEHHSISGSTQQSLPTNKGGGDPQSPDLWDILKKNVQYGAGQIGDFAHGAADAITSIPLGAANMVSHAIGGGNVQDAVNKASRAFGGKDVFTQPTGPETPAHAIGDMAGSLAAWEGTPGSANPLAGPFKRAFQTAGKAGTMGLLQSGGDAKTAAQDALLGGATEGALSRELEGAVSGKVDKFLKGDPKVYAVKAWSPTPRESDFTDHIEPTMEFALRNAPGNKISTNQEAMDAADKSIAELKEAYNKYLFNAKLRGATIDGGKIVKATRDSIPATMWAEDRAGAQSIIDRAQAAYGNRAISIDEANELASGKTAELKSLFDKATGARIASATAGGPEETLKAQRDQIVSDLNRALEPETGGSGPTYIHRLMAGQIDLKDAAERRKPVSIGSKPGSGLDAAKELVPNTIKAIFNPAGGVGFVKNPTLATPGTLMDGAVDPQVKKAFGSVRVNNDPLPAPRKIKNSTPNPSMMLETSLYGPTHADTGFMANRADKPFSAPLRPTNGPDLGDQSAFVSPKNLGQIAPTEASPQPAPGKPFTAPYRGPDVKSMTPEMQRQVNAANEARLKKEKDALDARRKYQKGSLTIGGEGPITKGQSPASDPSIQITGVPGTGSTATILAHKDGFGKGVLNIFQKPAAEKAGIDPRDVVGVTQVAPHATRDAYYQMAQRVHPSAPPEVKDAMNSHAAEISGKDILSPDGKKTISRAIPASSDSLKAKDANSVIAPDEKQAANQDKPDLASDIEGLLKLHGRHDLIEPISGLISGKRPPESASPKINTDVKDVAAKMYDAMNRIAFAPGTTVTFYRLRQQPELANVPKEIFDKAALHLENERKALLSLHDHAAALPPEQQKQFVTDGLGTHYVSIYKR